MSMDPPSVSSGPTWPAPGETWQYQVVGLGTFDALPRLQAALDGWGNEGWELAFLMDKASNWIGGTEKTFLVLKRRCAPDLSAGWKPDPSGRHRVRFWNGTAWSSHVVNQAGEQVTDGG